MARTKLGTLPFLILGILDDGPRSGYDLRRLFQVTPIGTFSDSPGSIYPALDGLARRRFVRGSTDRTRPLRPRRVWHVTVSGRAALLAWLREAVVGPAVGRDADLFGAKLAFMSGRLSRSEIARLAALHVAALRKHAEGVRAFARGNAAAYPFSARAALEGGVELLEARLSWVERVLRELERSRAR